MVPEVTTPIFSPKPLHTSYPFLGTPRSRSSKPTKYLFTPDSYCFFKYSESTKLLVNLVIQPKPASIGEVESSISFPYKQNPISKRSVSLAANPAGKIL